MSKPQYTLYTFGTPNGIKASITLEELGLQYETVAVDISKNTQKEEWFLKINPNGRIPALVDHSANDLAVFETGAIMWYLADKHPDKGLWPQDPALRAQIMSWLMFQMGGVGPMQGQANHFVRFAPIKVDYGIKRYVDETLRLFSVLENGLEGKQYLVDNTYGLADIANFSWVLVSFFAGIRLDDFPNLLAWVKRIAARPAVKKGVAVPSEGFPSKAVASADNLAGNPEILKLLEEGEAKIASARKALA